MEVPYLYISILLLLASYLVTTHLRRKSANLPPTVFPTIPIIGHLHLLKQPLHRSLAKIAAKNGPVLLLHLGFRRLLLVSSPSVAEECFTKYDVVFANRPKLLFGKIIGANYTGLAVSSYNENFRNLRRIASMEVLSTQRLNEFHDVRVDESKLLVVRLRSMSSPVTLKALFYELQLNVMMRMISGKRYFGSDNLEMQKEGKRFREILEETIVLAGAANVGDYLPFLSWLGMRRLENKLIALQEKRDVFFQGLIDQLRKSRGTEVGNGRKTMIDLLLSLQESQPEYYSDAIIRNLVLDLLIGGSDSTAGTMEWAMALLVNHPHFLKKAQAEMDQVIGHNRLIDESDMANLPYLRGIVNETFRLYPAGPLLFPHESSEDCVIGGYNIPRGTMLIVNQWAVHHDPKVWDDPERFNPERFIGLQGNRDGFKFMPFGSGRRICPGEGVAVRTVAMAVGSAIQCFDWERMSDDMVDMTEGPGPTLPKVERLVTKCKPRKEMMNLLSQL